MANTPESHGNSPPITPEMVEALRRAAVAAMSDKLVGLYNQDLTDPVTSKSRENTEVDLRCRIEALDPGARVVNPRAPWYQGCEAAVYPTWEQEADHGQVAVDRSAYDPNHGETGAEISRSGSNIPLETDHGLPGQTSYDSSAPYVDSSSGESTRWINPAGTGSYPPEMG